MVDFLSNMRSVSIALLQAVDQRLCALVHMTKTAYIGVSFHGLFTDYSDLYNIEPASGPDRDRFKANFIYHDGIICCKGDVCVLAVPDKDRWYRVYTCTSFPYQVQAFTKNCIKLGGNTVSVSADGAISIGGCSIKF
jgi:hypothetical protein